MSTNRISSCFLAVMFLISCSESTLQDDDSKNKELNKKSNLGEIPKKHSIYDVSNYNELLSVYKDALENESEKHYFTNFKHICLFKICEINFFFEMSSPEDRLFLINELVKMENAFPNIEHFYKVIVYMLKNDEVEMQKAQNLIEIFEDKNKAALQNLDPELKDKKLKSLKAGRLQVNLFIRTKAMEEFKNKKKE